MTGIKRHLRADLRKKIIVSAEIQNHLPVPWLFLAREQALVRSRVGAMRSVTPKHASLLPTQLPDILEQFLLLSSEK